MEQGDIDVLLSRCMKKGGGVNGRCNEVAWWVKNNLVDLHTRLLSETSFLPQDAKMVIRMWHVLHNKMSIPECNHAGCNNCLLYTSDAADE